MQTNRTLQNREIEEKKNEKQIVHLLDVYENNRFGRVENKVQGFLFSRGRLILLMCARGSSLV